MHICKAVLPDKRQLAEVIIFLIFISVTLNMHDISIRVSMQVSMRVKGKKSQLMQTITLFV